MKVLLCHNYYQQPGGEDQVFADEAALLESRGYEVLRYVRHSKDAGAMGRLQAVNQTLWNPLTFDELGKIIRTERPDIMHCTNIFPLISPAAYDAAQVEGLPVVQSLHNFRTLCVNGLLMREGSPCEKCVGRSVPWHGVAHKCYRDSHLASAVLATSISAQRLKRESRDPVTLYVALSEFSRQKFIQGGFPADRVVVKPNFVAPDPGVGDGFDGGAIFVGRLSEEKGIDLLLDAWKQITAPIPLTIVGDGPLAETVWEAAQGDRRITWLGRRPIEEIYHLVGDAAFLILPSRCYENCPKTILEAYSKGTPALVARQGAMREFVADGETGLHFTPGDAADLADRASQMFDATSTLTTMRSRAREEFETKYTAEVNFRKLAAIYDQALGLSSSTAPESTAAITAPPLEDAPEFVAEVLT